MMAACTGLSASSWTTIASSSSSSSTRLFSSNTRLKHNLNPFRVRGSSSSSANDPDCNDEECAPEKEIGKVSMEWLAGEKTKVVGTFPPRTRGWTGYVEKDTAGQTNIYSVEPVVYVAESAISSGTVGTSADGAENTSAIAAGLALLFIAGASSVVLQVGKQPTPVKTLEYSGPSLTYYINKFKPSEIIQVSAPSPAPAPETETQAEISTPSEPETTASEVSEVQVELESQPDTASLSLSLELS